MTISERLREERNRMNLTQRDFALLAGVKESTQRNYEAERSVPDANYFASVAHAVDVQYIITGERSAVPQSQRSILEANAGLGTAAYRDRFALVPRYRVEAAAGHGAANDADEILDHMAFQRQWLRAIGVEADSAAVIMARGDSMEPLIRDGDLVILDRAQTELCDGVFVIRRDGHLIIKRAQDRLDGTWMLTSENDAYEPIVIHGDQAVELHIIGRARYTWAGRRL